MRSSAISRPRWPSTLGLLAALAALAAAAPLWGQTSKPLPVAPLMPAPPAPPQVPLALRGVTVIDVRDGRRLPEQTVVVAGNRIQAMGTAKTVRVPTGARVVDARGKYLIPGFWDLHTHLLDHADFNYLLYLANGVTGIRDAGSDVPLATLSRWKEEIAAGTRVGPRLLVSGPALDGAGCGTSPEPYPHHVCVTTPAEARLMVDMLRTMGADMIKTYSMDSTIYFAVAAEARRIGVPFGGHAYVGGQVASDSGATILDHDTWFSPFVCGFSHESYVPEAVDAEACKAAAQRLRRNHTWVSVGGHLSLIRPGPMELYVPRRLPPGALQPFAPTSTADWARADTSKPGGMGARAKTAFSLMHASGIPLVVGTDAGVQPRYVSFCLPGFCLPETLVSLVLQGGLTPLEALQTATLNPALALRMTDSVGTVEAGKLADLILLDADPLADVWNTTHVRAVVANGRYYDRAALDRLLQTAQQVVQHYRAVAAATGEWEAP